MLIRQLECWQNFWNRYKLCHIKEKLDNSTHQNMCTEELQTRRARSTISGDDVESVNQSVCYKPDFADSKLAIVLNVPKRFPHHIMRKNLSPALQDTVGHELIQLEVQFG